MALSVQFPQSYNRNIFVIAIVLIYVIFCIPDNETKVWINFLEAIVNYLLIGLLAYIGCVEIKNKLTKSIFFAVIWDTLFSLINLGLFGFEFNFYSNCIRNMSIIIAFIYAYLILFKRHD
jgi:hypothetical protein